MANLFLALDPSDDERHALASVLADSGASAVIPGRRVSIDSWHMTLRFLGELTEVQTETVVARLDDTLAVEPGRVWLDGLHAFPKQSRATVIHCTPLAIPRASIAATKSEAPPLATR